jgi:hypothetical protein
MAMVAEWRRQWAQAGNAGNPHNSDFAFGFVELAGYHRTYGNASQVVSQLRRQQQLALAQNNVFRAVAMDLSDPAVVFDLQTGPGGEVHSRFKEQVGQRLSLGGRAVAFGERQLEWRGPTAVSAALCEQPGTTTTQEAVCVKFAHVGSAGILDFSRKYPGVGPLFEMGYSDGAHITWRNATSQKPSVTKQPRNDTVIVAALAALAPQRRAQGDNEETRATRTIVAVRYAQYNEPCDPLNDRPGMSPGGGGEHGARPTLGNMTANVTCALYSQYPDGTGGSVLLPAPSFWLNVSTTVI